MTGTRGRAKARKVRTSKDLRIGCDLIDTFKLFKLISKFLSEFFSSLRNICVNGRLVVFWWYSFVSWLFTVSFPSGNHATWRLRQTLDHCLGYRLILISHQEGFQIPKSRILYYVLLHDWQQLPERQASLITGLDTRLRLLTKTCLFLLCFMMI